MARPSAWHVWTEREVNQRSAWLRVRAAGSREHVCDVHVSVSAEGRVKVLGVARPGGSETARRPARAGEAPPEGWYVVQSKEAVQHASVQAARRKAQERVVFSERQGHYFDW